MTVGDTRVAIRQMLRVPHPRARKRRWIVLGVTAALALVVQLFRGSGWAELGLVAGIALGIPAVFTLLGRLWGWIALSLGLGIGLGVQPLFGVLGLELSVVTALFASIMSADVGAALARELARMPARGVERAAYPGRTLARGALASSGIAMALTLIVAIVAALRGIVVPTCDWWFGIVAFVGMPLASAALGGAAGHAMGVIVGPRRVLGAVLAQLPAIVVAIAAVWRFHAAPPVYTYNAVLGYFPGNMYDENVKLTMPLVWSRLEQLAWLVALLAAAAWRFDVASYRVRRAPRPANRRTGSLAIAIVAIAAAVALRWNGGTLGFAVDAEDLEVALGGRIETEHFVIYYSPTPEIEAEIQVIAEDHEFRYHQVVKELGVEPDHKLISFYFADRDQKARLHGSRDVEMAKPWRGEIYLDHRSFPHSSLRHEIAHAVAAEFGDWLWGIASRRVLGVPLLVSPGLVEGLAVAVDWPSGYDRPNPHESVRVIQALGKLPSIDSLLGLSFFSVSSAQGYTTAGSFLRFLLERHGNAKLRALYHNGGDFEAAYGLPLERLEREWRAMLDTIELPPNVIESQKERFRGGSVFAKSCPHAIAKRRDRAFDEFLDGDRDEAIDLMRRVCSDSEGEPRYRLELGDFLYSKDDDVPEAYLFWESVAYSEAITISMRANALERLARAAGAHGDFKRAGDLLAYAQKLPLDLNERRQLDAMAFAHAHTGPAGPAMRAIFFPPRGTPANALEQAQAAVAAEPELGMAHYLLGIQRSNKADWVAGAHEFELALARELPGISFVKNAARRLAVAAYRSHDRARLSIAASVLSGSAMTSGDRMLAKDWLDRVEFDLQRGR
ncbi:MAG: hypothetical protein ABI867_22325 [Kofleriaceae bacterium]